MTAILRHLGLVSVRKTILAAVTLALVAPVAVGVLAPAVQAQFSDSYNFLKAVRERKGDEATRFIDEPGSGAVIINTRDATTKQTALHIVIAGRDATWLSFLLAKGSNPNLADRDGTTPLMQAALLGFGEGVDLLVRSKATIDAQNRKGETALILAVLSNKTEIVRALIKAGANADKKDSVQGYSAREYAQRSGRTNGILAMIEAGSKDAKPATPPAGNDLNFKGIGDKKP